MNDAEYIEVVLDNVRPLLNEEDRELVRHHLFVACEETKDGKGGLTVWRRDVHNRFINIDRAMLWYYMPQGREFWSALSDGRGVAYALDKLPKDWSYG